MVIGLPEVPRRGAHDQRPFRTPRSSTSGSQTHCGVLRNAESIAAAAASMRSKVMQRVLTGGAGNGVITERIPVLACARSAVQGRDGILEQPNFGGQAHHRVTA